MPIAPIARFPLLLLFAYVCLDIANPLMPGAVQLVHGTIQVVEADRARVGGHAPIPAPLPVVMPVAPSVRGPSPLGRRRPVRTRLRGRGPHPKRPRASADHPPSAEDH